MLFDCWQRETEREREREREREKEKEEEREGGTNNTSRYVVLVKRTRTGEKRDKNNIIRKDLSSVK